MRECQAVKRLEQFNIGLRPFHGGLYLWVEWSPLIPSLLCICQSVLLYLIFDLNREKKNSFGSVKC